MKSFTALLFTALFILAAQAQHTVGLLSYAPEKAFEGYTLIYPHNQPNVYLLDNCGEIAHVWTDDANMRPGNTAYLMPDGRLIKTKRLSAVATDPIWAGGGGAWIEIRDWDNNLLWSFLQNDSTARLHHDFSVMPNGNLLLLAWEKKTATEAILAGRDPSLLPDGELWPDYIFEINPFTNEIVWEWHVWDHLIQDFDPSKDNFGVVANHPERVHFNFDTSDGDADWLHSNAMHYNAELDQIMLCVPAFNEFWVIDHSTTTAQAAGSTGGLAGRGGDLIYRWGYTLAYDQGDTTDQDLFFPHDAHWVGEFLQPSHPHYGKISIFNNRIGADYSAAHVIVPPFDMYDWAYSLSGNSWGPDTYDQTWTHPTPTNMYSTGLSSIQHLPNGNVLLCSGRQGYLFELTPGNEIVWEYITPFKAGLPVSQGDTLVSGDNLTFRAKRYPADFPAFAGKDLSSKGWIETSPDSLFCSQIVAVSEKEPDSDFRIYPNPTQGRFTLEWLGEQPAVLEIMDARGARVYRSQASFPTQEIDLSNLPDGLYWVRLGNKTQSLLLLR